MTTLSLFLKTLELVEDVGSFTSFLSATGAILLLVCLLCYQIFLTVGYTAIVSATLASTITLVLHCLEWLPQDMF